MSLMQIAHYNDFSDGLRKKLEERVSGFGKIVRYRFDILRTLLDPLTKTEDKIYPSVYTLDPARFQITDQDEKREGKSKVKNVALIDQIGEDGKPSRFTKVRVTEPMRAELVLYLQERPEDFQTAMYIELHPKNQNGLFPDPSKHQVIKRIDEAAQAREQTQAREAKKKALRAAEDMTYAELQDFADAMLWDRNEDELILRNKAEDLAETDPTYFNEIVGDKKTKYLSLIKRSLDNKTIGYDPADGRLFYVSTGQPIVILGANAGSEGWGRYAEWFLTAGDKADAVAKKLEGMLKKQPVTS